MLLREKIIVYLIYCIGIALFLDINTNIGNQLWEKKTGNTSRYVIHQNRKVGYVNGRGRLVIKPRLDLGPRYFTDNLVPIRINNQWGYMNRWGKTVIKPQFISAGEFSDGVAPVCSKGKFFRKCGYIDSEGEYMFEPLFEGALSFSEGLAAVSQKGKWGYIDRLGTVVINTQFEAAQSFSQGLAAVKLNGQWGFIDRKGAVAIYPQFDSVKRFSDGLAPAAPQTLWGYIDEKGRFAVEPRFSTADVFSGGLAAVKSPYEKGYIDTTGFMAIDKKYFSDIKGFSDGLAAVCVNNLWSDENKSKCGYIDASGDFVVEPKFDWAWDFHGGLARVGLDKNDIRRGYLDHEGVLVWDPADWEKSTYMKQMLFNVILIIVMFYGTQVGTFYRREQLSILKNNRRLLKLQAIKRQGSFDSGGLSSTPTLLCRHKTIPFRIYFMYSMMKAKQSEIYIEAPFPLDGNQRITFFINLSIERANTLDLRDDAVFHAGNVEFNRMVKILRSQNDERVSELLTDSIRRELVICPLHDCFFVIEVRNKKFTLRCDAIPRESMDYDWLLEVAALFYERMKMLG